MDRRQHSNLFERQDNWPIDEAAGDQPPAIAGELRSDRELVLRRLRRMGIQVLDVRPEDASPQLVSRYLDVKRREMV